jgi:hypothetical protein
MASVPETTAIDRIQQILASVATPGTFATRHTAGINALSFDVVGVGAVAMPLSRRTAQKLCEVARPARYGLREKTLLDRRVRDTWGISKHEIQLDAHQWQLALDRKLALIAHDLGVPEDAELRAELHNLLVYGPGQFFAPHQDSEKASGMIGSLVVLLPSDAKGGALVIEHHDEKVSYRGSPSQLVLVAFYADCRHEVRPVTSGYRAALTFNLFLDAADHRSARPTAPPRSPGDWSITTRLGCKCELCARLGEFLRASAQQLEWPLAKERRAHVHGTITSHELPLTHVTRRGGKPLHAGPHQDAGIVQARGVRTRDLGA